MLGRFFRSFLLFFFRVVFCSFFGRFGEASWELVGCQNRSKTGQIGLKTALGTIFFEKSEFSRVCECVCVGACILELFSETLSLCLSQNGARTILKRCFFRFVFCIDFLSFSGSILGGFWEALGAPNRSFLASVF